MEQQNNASKKKDILDFIEFIEPKPQTPIFLHLITTKRIYSMANMSKTAEAMIGLSESLTECSTACLRLHQANIRYILQKEVLRFYWKKQPLTSRILAWIFPRQYDPLIQVEWNDRFKC